MDKAWSGQSLTSIKYAIMWMLKLEVPEAFSEGSITMQLTKILGVEKWILKPSLMGAILIAATASTAVNAQERQEFERCFLQNVSRQNAPNLTLLLSIKRSCANLVSRDITVEARGSLNEATINSDGELQFYNGSRLHISEICIAVTHKYTKEVEKFCQNDFTSSLRSKMSIMSPDQDQSFLLERVIISPFKTANRIPIIASSKIQGNYWQSRDWSFSSVAGF